MGAPDKLLLQWSENSPDCQTVVGEECTLEQLTLYAVVVEEGLQQDVLQKNRWHQTGAKV